ncbi:A disintegrin and metalloproteinase with thrombospondin motifs 2-like [Cyprinus carpio]|uniref:A disintegrin and metalloproteinase with thrombospondin motifs 2-like n=1 Tax=Cyprinus carpio TaxID=7962 RepID=A0A9Q9VM04_CYPCA|nr:A disintegrin and metalloproteinase with thrombospondin motifs 2-like [Cyprinus carpio]
MDVTPGCAFFLIFLHFQHANTLYITNSIDSLQHVLREYGLVRPVSVDADGRFLSHAVSASRLSGQGSHRRRRRQANHHGETNEETNSEQDHLRHKETLFYNVTVFGQEFHLRLRLNSRLVAPGAKVEWLEDDNQTHSEPLLPSDCLYVGYVTNVQDTSVALSNCNGLVSYLLSYIKHHCMMFIQCIVG